MLHIFSHKIALLCTVLFVGTFFLQSDVQAQRTLESLNYEDFRPKPYYFGLALGYVNNDYRIARSKDFILNNEFMHTNSVSGPGFTIGVIGNLKIGEYFDVRLIPGFSFSGREIEFTSVNQDIRVKENIESTFLEVPFMVRYKSQPYSDMRFFLSTGIKYTYDITNPSRRRENKEIIQLSPHDYLLEAGFGIQFFFPYFILSPELKFSHGLDNILIYDRSLNRSKIFEQIFTQAISISFSFEG